MEVALCAVVALVGLEGMSRPFVYLARARSTFTLGTSTSPCGSGFITSDGKGVRGPPSFTVPAVSLDTLGEPYLSRVDVNRALAGERSRLSSRYGGGLGAAGSCGTCRLSPRAIQFWRAAHSHHPRGFSVSEMARERNSSLDPAPSETEVSAGRVQPLTMSA